MACGTTTKAPVLRAQRRFSTWYVTEGPMFTTRRHPARHLDAASRRAFECSTHPPHPHRWVALVWRSAHRQAPGAARPHHRPRHSPAATVVVRGTSQSGYGLPPGNAYPSSASTHSTTSASHQSVVLGEQGRIGGEPPASIRCTLSISLPRPSTPRRHRISDKLIHSGTGSICWLIQPVSGTGSDRSMPHLSVIDIMKRNRSTGSLGTPGRVGCRSRASAMTSMGYLTVTTAPGTRRCDHAAASAGPRSRSLPEISIAATVNSQRHSPLMRPAPLAHARASSLAKNTRSRCLDGCNRRVALAKCHEFQPGTRSPPRPLYCNGSSWVRPLSRMRSAASIGVP